jgi:oxygen-independent coproporphyrinogen-3 oxidase
MSGLYIHIPFCKQACTYCDFYFTTSGKMKDELCEALLREIQLQKYFFNRDNAAVINTVYFGGGTPSILPTNYLKAILDTIDEHFSLSDEAEITLEVNPDDCSKQRIKEWVKMGVNRVSCGVQSFADADLKFMNRSHTSAEAEGSVKRLQDAGITNISADLIYGLPNLTMQQWANHLEIAKQLNITHLSCYGLTVEEKTVLAHQVKTNLVKLDEQTAALHFEYLMQWSEQSSFEHYEISNLCKPGYQSKHNSAYWKGIPYLGIGPSAHSFNGEFRQYNVPNMFTYLNHIHQGKLPAEHEHLTPVQKYHEKIMTGLRLKEGIGMKNMENFFDDKISAHFQKILQNHLSKNNMMMINDNFALTNSGKLIADYIIQDFFVV